MRQDSKATTLAMPLPPRRLPAPARRASGADSKLTSLSRQGSSNTSDPSDPESGGYDSVRTLPARVLQPTLDAASQLAAPAPDGEVGHGEEAVSAPKKLEQTSECLS